ncbi:MAG: AMP-binding protein, partial [Desulfobacterium sp.]|nr:AMP-binding protein [Desulfobacterium sp.]
MNVAYLLVNSAGKYPDRTAIISEEKHFSYKAFNQRVNRLAHAMKQHGLKKGDRVAMMFFNTYQFAEVYFAAVKSGAVATPVNFRFVADEIEYIMNHCEACFFFFGKEFEETIESTYDKLSEIKYFVCVDAQKNGFAHDYENFYLPGNLKSRKLMPERTIPARLCILPVLR